MSEFPWSENLQQGTLRGLPFQVQTASNSESHRKAVIPIPGRNEPIIQKHGLNPLSKTIDMFLIGDDYFEQRFNFVEALRDPSEATMVHPYLGEMQIEVLNYSYTERHTEGRMIRFTISFIEVSSSEPLIQKDTKLEVLSTRQIALDNISTVFLETYSIAKKPFTVIDNVNNTVDVGFEAINSAKRVQQTSVDFSYAINTANDSVNTLVADADDLLSSTLGLLSFGTLPNDDEPPTSENAIGQINSLLSLSDFEADLKGSDDPSKQFNDLLVQAALVNIGGLAVTVDLDNFVSAKTLQREVVKFIDDKILLVGGLSDLIYNSVRDFKNAFVEDIDTRLADLKQLITIQRKQATPDVVLSYQLYGTYTHGDDIFNRNDDIIKHRMFVPANKDIVVKNEV